MNGRLLRHTLLRLRTSGWNRRRAFTYQNALHCGPEASPRWSRCLKLSFLPSFSHRLCPCFVAELIPFNPVDLPCIPCNPEVETVCFAESQEFFDRTSALLHKHHRLGGEDISEVSGKLYIQAPFGPCESRLQSSCSCRGCETKRFDCLEWVAAPASLKGRWWTYLKGNTTLAWRTSATPATQTASSRPYSSASPFEMLCCTGFSMLRRRKARKIACSPAWQPYSSR